MKLTIIGASGHGKVVADTAKKCGYTEIEFLDDNQRLVFCGRYPVTGNSKAAFQKENEVFVAIGNPQIRKKFLDELYKKDIKVPTLIHPQAVVAEDTAIGMGTVVMAGAVINPGARVGKGCIINTGCSVDHDCKLEDYVHVSVGAHLCGSVTIDSLSWVGTGAIVINNVTICGECMIGAGAVVIKDIDTPGTYIGIPAKKIT